MRLLGYDGHPGRKLRQCREDDPLGVAVGARDRAVIALELEFGRPAIMLHDGSAGAGSGFGET